MLTSILFNFYIVGYIAFVLITFVSQYKMRKQGRRNTEHFVGVLVGSVAWVVLLGVNLYDKKYS